MSVFWSTGCGNISILKVYLSGYFLERNRKGLKDQNYQVFERFLPVGSVEYCHGLWIQLGFEFKIKKGRKTKLGDYTYHPKLKKHTITINNDLNKYAFLITYLHEVAHLITYQKHQHKVLPHGVEWKQAFKEVALPVLNTTVLPEALNIAFSNYLKNPMASSCSDHRLLKALKPYDSHQGQFLSDLKKGENFRFQDKTYEVIGKKRTRYICLEKGSQRKYLISGNATVKKLV